jgi:hypothetical protein
VSKGHFHRDSGGLGVSVFYDPIVFLDMQFLGPISVNANLSDRSIESGATYSEQKTPKTLGLDMSEVSSMLHGSFEFIVARCVLQISCSLCKELP